MRLDIAAFTDIGRRKIKNEDAFGVCREDDPELRLFKEGALLCVADGLGGHTGGEIASKLAVSIITDIVKHPPIVPSTDNGEVDERDEGPLPVLRQAIQRANDSIFLTNRDQDLVRTKRPMGTTVLTAIIEPKKVYVGNVGDSRCYHFRDGDIIAHTEDHSWVDEQVRMGLMSKAEAETDHRRNIVTRCVGTHDEVSVDTYRWFVAPGDMLLLCTDGLVNMVPDKDIKAVFRAGGTSGEVAQRLIQLANENGGKDNITVVVATISPNPIRHVMLRTRAFVRRHHVSPAKIAATLIYGLVAFGLGYAVHAYL